MLISQGYRFSPNFEFIKFIFYFDKFILTGPDPEFQFPSSSIDPLILNYYNSYYKG
jgi:hypothetical protein